jgi:hypothetical protein
MYKPFYRCWWAFLHIKYCSWCAADFGIEDLLLSEPTSSLQKQKTPQTPHLSCFLSLFDKLCRVVGLAQWWQCCLAFYHHDACTTVTTHLYPFDNHNPNISIWRSQPKYIHLATPPNSPFCSWDFVFAQKYLHKKKEFLSFFLWCVCVCVFCSNFETFQHLKFSKTIYLSFNL